MFKKPSLDYTLHLLAAAPGSTTSYLPLPGQGRTISSTNKYSTIVTMAPIQTLTGVNVYFLTLLLLQLQVDVPPS